MTQTFETSDPELAHEFLTQAYAENHMSVNAVTGDVQLRHSRHDAGPYYHDTYLNSMDVTFATQPLGHLLVARVTSGQFERDTEATSERFGPGDVFLVSQPHQPYSCRSPGVNIDLVGIDLAAVADITGDPSMAVPGRLQLRAYQPVSPAAAQTWTRTADFVTSQLLTSDEATASPLVTGSTARLLAAAALAALPNNAVSAPEALEPSRDAHPRTVQRAVAFIDAHAGEDISIAAIAAAAFVTPRAVQLAFRRHLDTTPLEYLRQVRLQRAHADLLAADPAQTTVTAVSYRWGFPSPSRFSAYYRQTYGITPGRTLRS